jgi:hypothetical protein
MAFMMSSRPKRLLFPLLTLGLVLFVVELLAYAAIGVIHGNWFDLTPFGDQRRQLIGADPDAAPGSGGRPGFVETAAMHPFVGYVVDPLRSEWALTDFGYYESDRPLYRKTEDTVILGIFGGSFAHQFREAAIDRVVDALKQDPVFRGKRFIYTSTALGGYKQPQQLMTLNYLLALGGEFDIVVNIDGFNEVAIHEAENRLHNVFPAYPRSWYYHTLGLSDPGFVERSADVIRIRGRQRQSARSFSALPWRRLALANLVWSVRERSRQANLLAARADLETYRTGAERYVARGPKFNQVDDAQVYGELVSLWERSSVQMARLSQANGIVYVHALQPNQYVEDSKPLSEEERSQAYDRTHKYRSGVVKGYPLLTEAGGRLRENGVNFLDWTAAYKNVDETLYVDTCCHVNALGNELLIDDLVAAILTGYHDLEERP